MGVVDVLREKRRRRKNLLQEEAEDEKVIESDTPDAEQAEASQALPRKCWFELAGRRETVADALMLLEVHMQYHPIFVEMRNVERELDEKIDAAKTRLGRRPGQPTTQAPVNRSVKSDRKENGVTSNGSVSRGRGGTSSGRGRTSGRGRGAPSGRQGGYEA